MESSEIIEAFLFSVFDIVAIFGIIALAKWLGISILGTIVYPILFIISFYTEVHEHVLSLGSTEENAPYIAIFFLVGVSMFYFSVGVFFLKAGNIAVYIIVASLILFLHRIVATLTPAFPLLPYSVLGWTSSFVEILILFLSHHFMERFYPNGMIAQWWRGNANN
ncbi:hypothetical protein [Brucella intermedia]|uniref:hypothetical protein n=1 Tax=Brucella intermedia TaxID=94625 RepID=UPI002361650C|nr:hypothetical protein [Brucella intermedia]